MDHEFGNAGRPPHASPKRRRRTLFRNATIYRRAYDKGPRYPAVAVNVDGELWLPGNNASSS